MMQTAFRGTRLGTVVCSRVSMVFVTAHSHRDDSRVLLLVRTMGCPGNPSTPPAAGGLDFSSLLGAAGTGGTGTTGGNPWAAPPSTTPAAATPAPAAANPEETYATQLTQMNDMGFTDRAACVRALVACQGNVNAAVERLLGGDV